MLIAQGLTDDALIQKLIALFVLDYEPCHRAHLHVVPPSPPMGARERALLSTCTTAMLLATVWRHAAICELYRDETSLCWSHDASTDEACPPRARCGGFWVVGGAPFPAGLPAPPSSTNRGARGRAGGRGPTALAGRCVP